MRRFRAINLIAFCALVLLADDSDASIVSALKEYLPTFLRNPLKELKTLRHGIVPGTLWCGPGNIASNYSHLGVNQELDVCCRAHDFCKDYIGPRSTKYGLYNKFKLCRSSLCECDLQFYDCLKKAPGFVAFSVGKIYFKKCKQCFNVYYDADLCIERGLDMNEGKGRDDRRVFCAQFDRNPKWGKRYDTALPESTFTTKLPTWDDIRTPYFVSRNQPEEDENEDDEDDDTSEDMDIDPRMLNIF